MLTIQNLRYQIAQSDIIKDFNLHLPKGKIFTLFGASGCGKSTLLRCVAGILESESGIIDSAKNAFVFQEHSLFENLNALENVAVVMDSPDYAWILEQFALLFLSKKDALKYPSELSGGMRARVAFVRALAYNAPLLLLDEPFSGLDSQVKRILIEKLLDRVQNHNHSALLVTHDALETCLISDEIYFLKPRFMEVEKVVHLGVAQNLRNENFINETLKTHFNNRIYFE